MIYYSQDNDCDNLNCELELMRIELGKELGDINKIKVHQTWRNDINRHYDLNCPYYPQSYSQRSGLNRHLYNITSRQLKTLRLTAKHY